MLVVGGGPSGTAAAASAARAGADVALLERYNHLGGLSTGGLVIWIDRMTDWEGQLVIRGFAEELFDRLPADAVAGPSREDWGSQDSAKASHWAQRTAAYHGIVTWSPTIDPERLKLLSQEIVLERKVKLIYHSWAAVPIVQDGAVKGVVFESKEGRMAIMADVVVDATGDGDLFARAGAAFVNDIEEADVHHCMNTSWLFGGVDMGRWIDFKAGHPDAFSAFMARGREQLGLFERPFVSWRNDVALFMGPRQSGYSALDVDDLTAVEVRSHRAHGRAPRLLPGPCARLRGRLPDAERAADRRAPCAAPERRRRGAAQPVARGRALADEIGVSPAVSPKFPNISIPYGALVPQAARRPAGLRPPHLVRPQLARLHARDPAMLDHRTGGGHGSGTGLAGTDRTEGGRGDRAADGAAGPGRVPARRCRRRRAGGRTAVARNREQLSRSR